VGVEHTAVLTLNATLFHRKRSNLFHKAIPNEG